MRDAADLAARINHPSVGVVADAYHMHMEREPWRSILDDNEPELLDLLASVDVILVTSAADQHIARFQPSVPSIPVTFRIDEHSAETLAGRIAELGRGRLAAIG